MKITHPDLDQTNEPESRKENHLIELMIETHQLAQTNSQFLLRRMVIACIPVLIFNFASFLFISQHQILVWAPPPAISGIDWMATAKKDTTADPAQLFDLHPCLDDPDFNLDNLRFEY